MYSSRWLEVDVSLDRVGNRWVWSRGNSSHDQRLLVALTQSHPDLPRGLLAQMWTLDPFVLLTT